MPEDRRLAAIMFTDIVGYTALMQVDEKKALSALDHHKKIVERKVSQFNGNTIKFYGDGSLSIFESVYKAVVCALEIQKEIRDKPKVPLRIGIHTGEIISQEGDIFGDGINIASRLQSFGEEGSIVFSGDVYDKVKNHPELKSVYLGKYKLKNVQSKVDIYALANPGVKIPRKSAIQNKPEENDDVSSETIQKFKFKKTYSYILIVLFFLITVTIVGFKIKQNRKIQFAIDNTIPELIDEIKQVNDTDGGKNWDVYAKALDLQTHLKKNIQFLQLLQDITFPLTVYTDPNDAKIYAKPYSNPDTSWFYLGKSPLLNYLFPKGLSRIKIEKPDYETQSDVILKMFHARWESDTIQYQLFKKSEMPKDMVYVPSQMGDYWNVPFLPEFFIGDYWIDRYEVTNAQYKTFLDSGGYDNPDYWHFPFIEGEDTISMDEALTRFKDKTGWQGPEGWEMGDYKEGDDNIPITGISWYEAAAYAQFVNKALPTKFHWILVSQAHAAGEIVKLGNFDGKEPVEKGTYNSMTRYGTYDLPGNVSEWLFNPSGNNRLILGGNYKEPTYWYSSSLAISPWTRNELLGFRCIRYIDDTLKTELTQSLGGIKRDFEMVDLVSDEVFKFYLDRYNYEKTKLNPIQISKSESDNWTTEIISVEVPYENTPLKMYVYLPVNFKPPYQSILYFPGLDARQSNSIDKLDEGRRFDHLLKSGRAVIWPIYYNTYGRGKIKGATYNEREIQYKNIFTDIQIVCDYLQTRDDIDSERIAFFGVSWGGFVAPYVLAIENRIKLGILSLFGVQSGGERKEWDQIHYLQRVKIPLLLLGGRYDFDYSLEQQQAFYDFLGTPKPDKKWMLYETTHHIPRKDLINESLNWLDKYFGPVEKSITVEEVQ